jgi:hypothetical protein
MWFLKIGESITLRIFANLFQPFTYPEEAGIPIGGKSFSRYVMVQVHYNNPERKAGKIYYFLAVPEFVCMGYIV